MYWHCVWTGAGDVCCFGILLFLKGAMAFSCGSGGGVSSNIFFLQGTPHKFA